jgi:hypothetical protein
MTGFSRGCRFSFDPPDRPLELPYAEPADSSRQREYPARPTASLARCGAGATRVPQDGPRALAPALQRTITVESCRAGRWCYTPLSRSQVHDQLLEFVDDRGPERPPACLQTLGRLRSALLAHRQKQLRFTSAKGQGDRCHLCAPQMRSQPSPVGLINS